MKVYKTYSPVWNTEHILKFLKLSTCSMLNDFAVSLSIMTQPVCLNLKKGDHSSRLCEPFLPQRF